MRLKSQIHAIIAVAALLAFVVVGVWATLEVRRVHRLEVETQGKTMGLFLAKACALAIRGPSPREDLTALLATPGGDEDPPVVHAAVYDPTLTQVLARVGAVVPEAGVDDDPALREALAAAPGIVDVHEGGKLERYGPHGEDILEFTLPIVDGDQVKGVLRLSLALASPAANVSPTIKLMLGAGAVVAFLWALLYKVLQSRVLDPILGLHQAILRVRRGDVATRVDVRREDEIGILAQSFNELIGVLVERDSLQLRLEEANRLEQTHAELREAHKKLKEAQERLVLEEKHASLGRLVHGLNHELNNPLSAAKNMIPPLESAMAALREHLLRPATPVVEAAVLANGEALPSTLTTTSAPSVAGERAIPPTATTPAPNLIEAAPAPVAAPTQSTRLPLAGSPSPAHSARLSPAGSARFTIPVPSGPPPAIPELLEDARDATGVIARSVARAIAIVRDLGQFSKLGTTDLETCELKTIIDDAVIACVQELGPEGRVTVSVDVPLVDGAPLKLKAFPNLLGQVFVNLITNSAQAIEGPGKVKISVRLLNNRDRVRVEVEDNGPGIPRENLPKIFEPFFTTKPPGRGTGLGLSICMGVIQKHGGTIEAIRRRRGALFVIELPLEPVVEPKDPRASASLFPAASTVIIAR